MLPRKYILHNFQKTFEYVNCEYSLALKTPRIIINLLAVLENTCHFVGTVWVMSPAVTLPSSLIFQWQNSPGYRVKEKFLLELFLR